MNKTLRTKLKEEIFWVVLMLAMLAVVWYAAHETTHESDDILLLQLVGQIVGMIFLLILYGVRFLGSRNLNEFDEKYDALILLLYGCFFTDALFGSVNGKPGAQTAMMILLGVQIILTTIYCVVLWFYVEQFFVRTKEMIKVRWAIIIINVLYLGDILLDPVLHHLTYIADDGKLCYNYKWTFTVAIPIVLYFIVFIGYMYYARVNKTTRRAFVSAMALYFVSVVITWFWKSDVINITDLIINYAMLFGLFIFFFYVHTEEHEKSIKQQLENQDLRRSIVASQISPHFLYNALATISAICEEEESPEAAKAVNRFASYLRMNLDSLGSGKMVKFRDELEHIKTYLWIEKLRFGDDLKVEYDIGYDYFFIPPLLIQPIVENAVIHGVLKKEEGGTVKIRTARDGGDIVVTVEDNGVGFDKYATQRSNKTHIGLSNVRERLENICKGTMNVESKVGIGTKVTIRIPIEGE